MECLEKESDKNLGETLELSVEPTHLVISEPNCDRKTEYDFPKGNGKLSETLTCRLWSLKVCSMSTSVEAPSVEALSGGVERSPRVESHSPRPRP